MGMKTREDVMGKDPSLLQPPQSYYAPRWLAIPREPYRLRAGSMETPAEDSSKSTTSQNSPSELEKQAQTPETPQNPNPESPQDHPRRHQAPPTFVQNPEFQTYPAKNRSNSSSSDRSREFQRRHRAHQNPPQSPDYSISNSRSPRRRQDSESSNDSVIIVSPQSSSFRKLEESHRRHQRQNHQNLSPPRSPQYDFSDSRRRQGASESRSRAANFQYSEDRRRQNSEDSQFRSRKNYENSRRRQGYSEDSEDRNRQNLGNSEFRRRRDSGESGISNSRYSDSGSRQNRENSRNFESGFGKRGESEISNFRRRQDSDSRRQEYNRRNDSPSPPMSPLSPHDDSDAIFSNQIFNTNSNFYDFQLDLHQNFQKLMTSNTEELLMAGYSQRDVMEIRNRQRKIEEARIRLEEIDRNREVVTSAPEIQIRPEDFPNLRRARFMPDGSLQIRQNPKDSENPKSKNHPSESESRRRQEIEDKFFKNIERRIGLNKDSGESGRLQNPDSENFRSQHSPEVEHHHFESMEYDSGFRRRQNSEDSQSRSRQNYENSRRRQGYSEDSVDKNRRNLGNSEFRRRQDSGESGGFLNSRYSDSGSRQNRENSRNFDSGAGRRQESEMSNFRRRQDSDSESRRHGISKSRSPHRSESRRRQTSRSRNYEDSEFRRRQNSKFLFCRTPPSDNSTISMTSRAPESLYRNSEDVENLKIDKNFQKEKNQKTWGYQDDSSSSKRRHPFEEKDPFKSDVKRNRSSISLESSNSSSSSSKLRPFYNTDPDRFEEEYEEMRKKYQEKAKFKYEREGVHAISSLTRVHIERHRHRLERESKCKLRFGDDRYFGCYYNVEISNAKKPENVRKAREILDEFGFEMMRNEVEKNGESRMDSFIYNVPEGVRWHLMSPKYMERIWAIKRTTGISAIVDLQRGLSPHLNLPLHFEGHPERLHDAKLAMDCLVAEIQKILDSPTVNVEFPDEIVKILLKHKGETIKRIQKKSKTWIQIEDRELKSGRSLYEGAELRKISIQGAPENVEIAKILLAEVQKTSTWYIPANMFSRMVGARGANIKRIRSFSEATVILADTVEEKSGVHIMEIRGGEKEVREAERLVKECLDRFCEQDEMEESR